MKKLTICAKKTCQKNIFPKDIFHAANEWGVNFYPIYFSLQGNFFLKNSKYNKLLKGTMLLAVWCDAQHWKCMP